MAKGRKGGQMGKGRSPTRHSPRKKQPQVEEREMETGGDVSETNQGDTPSGEESDVFPPSQQISKFTATQDELIASFSEDNQAFYDLTNPDYKIKVKKNALLKEFADEMGGALPDYDAVQDNANRFFQVEGPEEEGEVWQGTDQAARLTPLQEFKLSRYELVAPHYRGRTKSSVLSSVAQPESSSDEAGEDSQSGREAKRQDNESSLPASKKSKKKEPKRDLTEVLVELLSDSRKEMKESQAEVAKVSTSALYSTRSPSEREAWAQWMTSVHQEIPPELWRTYLQETFLVPCALSGITRPPNSSICSSNRTAVWPHTNSNRHFRDRLRHVSGPSRSTPAAGRTLSGGDQPGHGHPPRQHSPVQEE